MNFSLIALVHCEYLWKVEIDKMRVNLATGQEFNKYRIPFGQLRSRFVAVGKCGLR